MKVTVKQTAPEPKPRFRAHIQIEYTPDEMEQLTDPEMVAALYNIDSALDEQIDQIDRETAQLIENLWWDADAKRQALIREHQQLEKDIATR